MGESLDSYVTFEVTGAVQMRRLNAEFEQIVGSTFTIAVRPQRLRGTKQKIINISKGEKEDWIVILETDELIYGLPEKNFYNYVEMGHIELHED
jgi:hypothetical protein